MTPLFGAKRPHEWRGFAYGTGVNLEPMSDDSSISPLATRWPSLDELLGPNEPAEPNTPWVRMIAALNACGSATVDDTSGGLGNDLDFKLLLVMREWSDAVVVTSATVNREGYGPVEPTETRPEPPALAIVTRSLSIEPSSPAISEARTPTIVVCPGANLNEPALRERAQALGDAGAIVLTADHGPAGIIDALHSRGLNKLSLEGGPSLYSQFIASDLVDEAYLTLDPTLTATVDTPLVNPHGDPTSTPRAFELAGLHPCPDSVVFLHYTRRR